MEYDKIEVTEWLESNECPWDDRTFPIAVAYGNIEVMEWLKSEKCPWDAYTFSIAAQYSKIEIMEWLLYNRTVNQSLYLCIMQYTIIIYGIDILLSTL